MITVCAVLAEVGIDWVSRPASIPTNLRRSLTLKATLERGFRFAFAPFPKLMPAAACVVFCSGFDLNRAIRYYIACSASQESEHVLARERRKLMMHIN